MNVRDYLRKTDADWRAILQKLQLVGHVSWRYVA